MSIPSRLAAHLLLSPLVGTAFLYGRPGAVAPAGLGLLGPTGEKFRTTEAVKFSATGVSQPAPIERAEFDNYRPGPIPQAAPIPFVGASADQFLAQIKQATAWVKHLSSPVSFVESELGRPFFRESFLGPVPYKRHMALSSVADDGGEPPRSMAETMREALSDVLVNQAPNRRSKKELMAAFGAHPLVRALREGVIPTGSPAAPEKLPAWEANSRVVLAGAKRWALKRWGRS